MNISSVQRCTRWGHLSRLVTGFLCVLAGLPNASLRAQDRQPPGLDRDRDAMIRAARIMRKIDKNGDGTFNQSEGETAWNRYRLLDTNHDQTLSISELSKERAAFLLTGGQHKLNVVYTST